MRTWHALHLAAMGLALLVVVDSHKEDFALKYCCEISGFSLIRASHLSMIMAILFPDSPTISTRDGERFGVMGRLGYCYCNSFPLQEYRTSV